MKRHFLFIIALVSFALLHSCGLTDDRASKARDYMQQRIARESGNALKLESLKKTDGSEHDVMGEKVYALEWDAQITTQKDVWTCLFHHSDGDRINTWNSFKVDTSNEKTRCTDGEYKLYKSGTTIGLKGNCEYEKTEQGWRIIDSHMSSIDNPDNNSATK